MIFLVICASCVFCCCCFALDFFSSLHSFFIVVSFWIFRTFFSSFVWGLPVLLCCRCVCVFFSDLVMRVHTIQIEYATKAAYNLYTWCFFFVLLSHSHWLVIFSQWLLLQFFFLWLLCVIHIKLFVYIFSSLPTLKNFDPR